MPACSSTGSPQNAEALKAAAEATTRYGKLITIEPFMDSDIVFLICRYTTGDAAGQNMVTVATDAMCAYIVEHTPVKPRHWFIEGNFSGDKKASYLGLHHGRGRKVTASVDHPDALIRRCLHVEPEALLAYGRVAAPGRGAERPARRPGALRQRACRLLHRDRPGRGLRLGIGGRLHPHGARATTACSSR